MPLVAPSVRGFRPGAKPQKRLDSFHLFDAASLAIPLAGKRPPAVWACVFCISRLCLPPLTDFGGFASLHSSPQPPPLSIRCSLPCSQARQTWKLGRQLLHFPAVSKPKGPANLCSSLQSKQSRIVIHHNRLPFPKHTLSLHHQSASPAQPVAARLPGLAIAAHPTPIPSRPSKSPRIPSPPTTRHTLGCTLPALR